MALPARYLIAYASQPTPVRDTGAARRRARPVTNASDFYHDRDCSQIRKILPRFTTFHSIWRALRFIKALSARLGNQPAGGLLLQLAQIEEIIMNRTIRISLATVAGIIVVSSLVSARVSAQVAGTTLLGVEYAELRDVAAGWSAKRQLLGRPVYNEKNEKIGSVDDLIISPSKALSYAIIGAGGFLGVAKHDVAIPVNQFTETDGKIVLAGATKDAIKSMPEFEYAQR